MIKKTLYFGNPYYLSLRNGQLLVRWTEREVKDGSMPEQCVSRPIEDIGVLVLDHRQITITSSLLAALLDNNVAVIQCDEKGMPVGLFLPLAGNNVQTERFRMQIDASLPLKKQLWQQTVKSKIMNQSYVLRSCTQASHDCMEIWAGQVRSGDSQNLEARAASYYWKHLFDSIPSFTRDREGVSPNNYLNYGYAILRAVVARALVGSGLLPTLGIHHHNKYNAYCLADDIMEPYRPFVDKLVIEMVNKFGCQSEMSKELKSELLKIPTLDVLIGGKRSPLMIAVSLTTASLVRCFNNEQRTIQYPTFEL